MEQKQVSMHTTPVENKEVDDVICLVDEKDNLKLYCYKTCSELDSEELKMKRSIIQDGDGNAIATSLPYTDEYVINDDFKFPELVLDDYEAYPSIEGSLIRLVNHDGKWLVTTNRKLDAFKSYWSSHFSFGQLFVNHIFTIYKDNNIETFYQKLDPSNVYFFLLRPTIESRIVCHVDSTKPSLYFVGTLAREKTDGVLEMNKDILSDIPRMEMITFKDTNELVEYVKNVNYWEYQGIILFHKTRNHQVKFLNAQYKKYWSIRNNNPNLFLRYFEIRQDSKLLEDFFKVYPKFIVIADKFESQIFEVSKYLHQAYVDRYIRKQYLSLPKQEYVVLKKAHDWHNVDRNYNRMYRHKMLSLINEEKPIHLYQIVKRHFKY